MNTSAFSTEVHCPYCGKKYYMIIARKSGKSWPVNLKCPYCNQIMPTLTKYFDDN